MNQSKINITEIPIIVRVIGNPIPVVYKIFDIEENSKEAKFTISRSILIGGEIECRLKEYIYRNKEDAPHDIVLVFGVLDEKSQSSEISHFLHEKLHEFSKTMVIIGRQEVNIDQDRINQALEESQS
ncbi:hypothetical protein [Nitrosopumilus sp.]|uniref:hypothetical protein n=1 Tax=Nitrosopumilus sp. TaxID=2024843 RepID=UPI003D14EA40